MGYWGGSESWHSTSPELTWEQWNKRELESLFRVALFPGKSRTSGATNAAIA